MKKNKYELTETGLEELKDELYNLKNVKRVENLEDIKEARAQGDLSENADYDAARNEQAKIEGRIKEIEVILKNAIVIKKNKGGNVIDIGSEVSLTFLNNKKKSKVVLVGTLEANPLEGKISVESPLGKAIRDHQKGDKVKVRMETGRTFEVQIDNIKD